MRHIVRTSADDAPLDFASRDAETVGVLFMPLLFSYNVTAIIYISDV